MKRLSIIALLFLAAICSWASGTDYSQYHYQPTVSFNAWWGTASMVVQVMDKQEVMENVEVGVFTKGSNPVLRGVAKYNAKDGVWWITIHGDEAELMEFHLWNSASGEEKIVNQNWMFQPYGIDGTLAEPYIIYWTKPRTINENSLRINACSLKSEDLDEDGTWELLVNLNNPDDRFSGVSFDLTLPSKIKINYDDSYWLYKGNRTSAKVKKGKQYVDVFKSPEVTLADGVYNVSLSSALADSAINGTFGDIIAIYVSPEVGLVDGANTLRLSNIILTRTDGSFVSADDYEATLLVGGINAVAGREVTIKGEVTQQFLDEITCSDSILSYDLTGAFIPDGATLTLSNPNALVFVAQEDKDKLTNDTNIVSDGICSSLVLTEGYDFHTTSSFTASTATFTRELTGLGTICLPFAPSTDGFEYYELAADRGTALSFIKVERPEAGKPYLYRKTGTSNEIKSIDVDVSPDEAGAKILGNVWTMRGAYSTLMLTAADNAFVLYDDMICRNAGTLTVKPFRAYFVCENPETQSVSVFIDGLDGIDRITTDISAGEGVYSVSGQKIGESYKGVVISNGVKLLIK